VYFFAIVALQGTLAPEETQSFVMDSGGVSSPSIFQDVRACLGITRPSSKRRASFASRDSLHAVVLGEPTALGATGSEETSGTTHHMPREFPGGEDTGLFQNEVVTHRAQLLLDLYARFGDQAIAHTNGLFAGIIWDERARRLWAASDRVGGYCPIYYARYGDRLALSSNVHALLALPGVPRALHPEALHELMATGYVLPPRTLLREIQQLAPGEALTLHEGRMTRRTVDRISPDPGESSDEHVSSGGAFAASRETGDSAGTDASGQLAGLLDRALQRATVSPSNQGFLLSGGIDSSTLLAIAARRAPAPLESYTGAFPGTALNEGPYARRVAESFGSRHHLLDLGNPEQLEALPKIIWHLGFPTQDFSVVPTYHLLCAVAAEHSVAISGDGPDHLFCRYAPLAAKRNIAPWTDWFPRCARGLLPGSGRTFLEKIRRAGASDFMQAYRDLFVIPAWGLDGEDLLQKLVPGYRPPAVSESDYLIERRSRSRSDWSGLLADLTYLDFYVDGSLGVFNKVGAMSRAAGITIREPYLDRDVVDGILRLPWNKRLRGSRMRLLASRGKSKYLLKHELAPKLLPPETIMKTKGGFTPPLGGWLRSRFEKISARDWLCAPLRTGEILDLETVDRLIEEHRAGARDWTRLLFLLLSLDLWMRMTLVDPIREEPDWGLAELFG